MRLTKSVIMLVLFTLVFSQFYLHGTNNRALDQSERLAALCKVWGLLKYYHPEVAKGEIDWDAVLITAIPAVKAAEDFESFNQEISNLIEEAGGVDISDYNPGTPAHPNEALFKWIKDRDILDTKVGKKLQTVQKKHVPAENYWFQADPWDDTAIAPNEKAYEQMDFPDENFRLLALFRTWNFINYFFPYRDLMDEDWEDVLEEFIPKYIDISDACEYQSVLKEYIVQLDDGHASRIVPSQASCSPYLRLFAPFEIRYIEGKTMFSEIYSPDLLNSPDEIKVGDIILKRNGENIDTYRERIKPSIAASNEACLQRYINWGIFNTTTGTTNLTVLRDGQEKEVTVNSLDIPTYSAARSEFYAQLPKWKILPGNIGYAMMANIDNQEALQAIDELKDAKAVIFDLRRGSLGAHWDFLYYMLLPERTETVTFAIPNLSYPGSYRISTAVHGLSQNPDYYKGKVIILVNENTISNGEFVSMMLQAAPDATVIGNQTAGADGNVTTIIAPGGINIRFSGLGVTYPDGTQTQRIGVDIDIEVKPTVEGIQQGRDEVLEKAVQFIEESDG